MSKSQNQRNRLSLLSKTNTQTKSPNKSTLGHSKNTNKLSNQKKDRSWYNSTFIEQYMDILTKYRKVYYFNTSFLHKYIGTGITGVRRWIKQDIFKKRFLFFPTHVNKNHWILIVVNIKKKQLCHYNSYGYYYEKPIKVIVNFLKEWQIEQGKKPSIFETVDSPTPAQKNKYDSGPWVLQVAKCLTFDKPLEFSQKDMQFFRQIQSMEMDFKIIRMYSSKNVFKIRRTLRYIKKFGLKKKNQIKEHKTKLGKDSQKQKQTKNKKIKIMKKNNMDIDRSSPVNDDTKSI